MERIEAAEQSRIKGKAAYEAALDKGDEAGMAAGLKTIRAAVAEIPKLQSQRRDLRAVYRKIERARADAGPDDEDADGPISAG